MITSLPDLLIIGGAALLIFGPKRLPELAKSLGKGIREFKKAVDGDADVPQSTEAQVLPPAHQSVPQATPSAQAQAQPQPVGSSTDHHNG